MENEGSEVVIKNRQSQVKQSSPSKYGVFHAFFGTFGNFL